VIATEHTAITFLDSGKDPIEQRLSGSTNSDPSFRVVTGYQAFNLVVECPVFNFNKTEIHFFMRGSGRHLLLTLFQDLNPF
jgi:hypothetical protein